MKGRQFKDNRTGEIVKVIDSFENIAILENKQKIDVRRLGDPNYFTEQIDPNDFFGNRSAFESLTEKIKNIPTNNIIDEGDVSTQLNFGDNSTRPVSDESAIIYSSIDDEREELARKYGVVDNRDAVIRQQEALSKIIGDDDDLPTPPTSYNQPIINEPVQRVEVQRDEEGQVLQKPVAKPEDPIHVMFRNAKKVVDFSLDLTLNNKIPRLDFIEMMEDSYERSIIDFLASEITNELLKNPENLKFQISEKIKQMVYDKPVKKTVTRKPTIKKTTTSNSNLKKDLNKITEKSEPKRGRRKKETEQQ